MRNRSTAQPGSSTAPSHNSGYTLGLWFLAMMREHDEFEVETDKAGEWPVPFFSETVRQVLVE